MAIALGIAVGTAVLLLKSKAPIRTVYIDNNNLPLHLQQWLVNLGIPFRKVPDEKAVFAFEATTISGVPVAIRRERNREAYLTFSARFNPAPEHNKTFEDLSSYKKQIFLRTFQMEAAKARMTVAPFENFGKFVTQNLLFITSSLTESDILKGIDAANFSTIFLQNMLALMLEEEKTRRVSDSVSPLPQSPS
jgi:hypothetical protein